MMWLGHKDSKMVAHYYHLHDDERPGSKARLVLSKEVGGTDAAGAK